VTKSNPENAGTLSRLRVESCRRDVLDHVIPLNEVHLKRLLTEYVD
jgi:hypothetical protein